MRKLIKNLRVRKKILLIISINIFFTALMSIIAHQSLDKVDDIKYDIVQVGKAASRQLTADMMHDALRADVYNAFLTDDGDVDGNKEVKRDFAEHVHIFKTSLNELIHFKVDTKIKKQVDAVQAPLKNYIKASRYFIDKGLYTKYDLHSPTGHKEIREYKNTFDQLAVQMEKLSEVIEVEYTHQQDLLTNYTHKIQLTLFILGIIVAIIALTLSLYVSKLIEKPILITEDVLDQISEGAITGEIEVEGKDETANMLRSLNTVVHNLSNVRDYVSEVGNGNYEAEIEIFKNQGPIFESLHQMTTKIKANAEEDKKRNWVNEGLAKFTDIIRDTDDIERFYNNIISNLLRYLGANQGYLYVLNETDDNEPFMEIKAVYAYGKQRYLEEKNIIRYKQGLVGQCWFDKEPLFFTEIPSDYVNITSGIGEATPRCIFITPLMVNEKICGVIEIASFHPMEDYKMEFVNKLSETIASTITSVQTNERTKELLYHSQQQTEEMRAQEEEMRAQEEEMRQNIEELNATQSEMNKKEREMTKMVHAMQQQEEELRQNMEEMKATQEEMEIQNKKIAEDAAFSKGILEGINATMAVIEFEPDGTVITANENFLSTTEYSLSEIQGKHHFMFVPEQLKTLVEYKEFWYNLSHGKENHGVFERISKSGKKILLNAIYNPIKDSNGKVIKVIKFATDITRAEAH